MKPRVLFVTTDFDQVTNGPGVYSQHLWNFFADDSEIDFHLCALNSNFKHEQLHLLGYRPPGFGSAIYKAISNLATEVIKRLGAKTILHANMAHIISPTLAASAPSIVQINDTEVCGWQPSLNGVKRHGLRRNLALCWRKQRENSVVHQSTKVICNSRHTENAVQSAYQLPATKVQTIYKAVDLKPYLQAAEEHSNRKPNEVPQLVFIGSNWRRKGLDVLLKAVEQLIANGRMVRLSVYGSPDGKMQAEFEMLTDTLGISRHVDFAGLADPEMVPGILTKSDALVLPSREEALGLVLIESLASGIPVVGTRVGGIPEVVVDDVCGKLVEAEDSQALANAIRETLERANLPQHIQHRQNTVEHFRSERLRDQLVTLYASSELH